MNIDEVRGALQRLNFSFIKFEAHSVSQTLGLMARTKVLAGPHRVGFSSAIFGRPTLNVVEIFS